MLPHVSLGRGAGALIAGLMTLVVIGRAHTPAQQPTFRAAVDRVALDLTVLDRAGAPVSDLRIGDVTLTVDGRLRQIESLDFIRIAPATAPAPALRAPNPFGTNLPAEAGRTVLLVFDRDSYRDGGQKLVTDAATRFLDTLTSRDRVGLATLPYGKVEVDLTTDHARIRKVLPTIAGYGPAANPGTAEFRTPANAQSLTPRMPECAALNSLITFLDGIKKTAGPKTIVYVAGAFPSNIPPSPCAPLFSDLTKAAENARATFYGLNPTLGGIGESTLTIATGGVQLNPSGTMDHVFSQVARESSAYYVLGFNSLQSERDGKHHSISLKVGRAGVTVRTRPGFVVPRDEIASKPAPAESKSAPRNLLRDFDSHSDVPLRAAAFAFRGAVPTHLKILVMAESAGSTATITATAFGLYDAKGKNVAGWDADAKELAMRPIVSASSQPPGSYRLRAAATDSAGRMGAADYEFAAVLTKAGPYQLSSLMLGVMEREEFKPRMQFSTETTITAYLEAYATLASAKAPEIVFVVTPARANTSAARIPGSIHDTRSGKWIVTGSIPLSNLPLGDSIVRVLINGVPEGQTVVRTLRKIDR